MTFTPEQICDAFLKCDPYPSYIEMHPKDFFDFIGSHHSVFERATRDDEGNWKWFNVRVKLHPALKGFRVVPQPSYAYLDYAVPTKITDVTTLVPPPVNDVKSEDFDDSERAEYDRLEALARERF